MRARSTYKYSFPRFGTLTKSNSLPNNGSAFRNPEYGIDAGHRHRRCYDRLVGACGIHCMKLLLVGASGLVGQQVLALALAERSVGRLIAPTRKPLAAAPGLENPQVDFDRLPQGADWWNVDAVICTLGTTMALAGSQAAFRRVDHDYPLAVARLARAAGAGAFALNSALGADANSRVFYNRVKGEAEAAIAALGYPSLTLVRPSLLDGGPRPDNRPGEHLGLWIAKTFRPLVPARYRAVATEAVARALLSAALGHAPGVHIVESERIT